MTIIDTELYGKSTLRVVRNRKQNTNTVIYVPTGAEVRLTNAQIDSREIVRALERIAGFPHRAKEAFETIRQASTALPA